MKKCKKCQKEFSKFITINNKKYDCRSRVYCLECSPFNTRKLCGPDPIFRLKTDDPSLTYKTCFECGVLFKNACTNGICSTCRNRKARTSKKEKLLSLFNNKCYVCGYNKYYGSLDLHHINPDDKCFSFSNSYNISWKSLVDEAKKCILLCRNCHSELHGGIITQDFSNIKNELPIHILPENDIYKLPVYEFERKYKIFRPKKLIDNDVLDFII